MWVSSGDCKTALSQSPLLLYYTFLTKSPNFFFIDFLYSKVADKQKTGKIIINQ